MATAFLVREATNRAFRALNYSPEVEAFRARTGLRHARLGTLLASLGQAYGAVFTRLDCAPGHGVELITQGDMFAAEPAGRTIRLDSMTRPERHRVRRWQVLIAGAGTLGENELYGRSIIADGRLVDRFVGPHAMVLTFADEGGPLNLYTYAFLCTAIGIRAVRSASFGTKILGVRKDILSELPVPLPDDAIVARVAGLIARAVEKRELFAQRLASARAVIETAPEMKAANAMVRTARGRCIVWRGELRSLAAWNHVSAGEALEFLQATWPRRIRDVVRPDGVFYGNLRKRTPCSEGYGVPLLSQRDLHQVRPFPVWIDPRGVDASTVFSPENSIAMAGVGGTAEGNALGRPAFIDARLSGCALTQHVLRIVPQPDHAAVLHTFLSTEVGRRLVLTTAAGTIVQQLRRDLVADLPVPELAAPRRAELARHHAAAYGCLKRSVDLEDEAIRIIEEEVLPQWLA